MNLDVIRQFHWQWGVYHVRWIEVWAINNDSSINVLQAWLLA